jgi:uncharacterized protein with GYD domain
MTKYIELMNWTDQGSRNVKDSPSRLDAAKATAKRKASLKRLADG